jgi:hypothetical protein
MSIKPQPNLWQCGPFALKHALVMLGIFADENDISRKAGTRAAYGTDERQLTRAAREFNCTMLSIRRHHHDTARADLLSFLRRGIPVLICAYEWSHWITVVKAERGKYIVLDSRDKAVLTILTWSELKNRWVYYLQDEEDRTHWEIIYDFYPILPRFRIRTKARFSIGRARYLRRPENRALARYWDQYVADLLTICMPRTSLSRQVISLGEFFRRHEGMILDQVNYWHGSIDRKDAGRVLAHMHFVADTYGLVIPREDEKRALVGITTILSLWAASQVRIPPFYR